MEGKEPSADAGFGSSRFICLDKSVQSITPEVLFLKKTRLFPQQWSEKA
jgi:hypothetical protein